MDPVFFASVSKFALKALPFVIAAAVGFSSAEAYEHKVPWGLAHQLARERAAEPTKAAAARKDGIDAQAAADRASFGAWSASLEVCNTNLTAARDAAGAAQARADARTSQQASAAYRLGRATCGGTDHATTTTAPTAGGAVPSGVRDDGDDFAGLVAAGAAAPAP